MRAVFVILAVPLATGVLVEDLALGEARAAAVERRALPLQAELRATVQALPKTGAGCLGPAAARYALHRVFVQKGWFVHGLQDLDPVGNASEGSMSPVAMLQDQVPEAQAVFENHLQRGGLCLRDLALLAGLLEDLVHRETMQRVSAAFKAKKVPLVGRVTVEHLASMLDYVMMSYILEVANLEGTGLDVAENVSVYLEGKRPMEEVYPAWPRTQKFLRDVQAVVAPARRGSLSFEEITHVVEEVQEHYGRWHDESDCLDMKNVLFGMERCPGRVDLSRFYAASLYEDRWQFSESVTYLRDLGALDESGPAPSVVVSNYVLGASNCVGTSRFYAQCCVDPCDDLMAKLEKGLAAPAAPPAAVAAAVRAVLPSTAAPSHSLEEIAHDGLVVLHGRLFAQWLHQAFPQQCPMPPLAGAKLRQELPRDFTRRTGEDYIATDAAMRRAAARRPEDEKTRCELPWTAGEELLAGSTGSQLTTSAWPVWPAWTNPTVAAAALLAAAAAVAGAWVAKRQVRAARGPLLATEAASA